MRYERFLLVSPIIPIPFLVEFFGPEVTKQGKIAPSEVIANDGKQGVKCYHEDGGRFALFEKMVMIIYTVHVT